MFAGVPQREKDVLLELYHSTDGSRWRTVWELSAPVSTWHGVGLQNGRVVSLELTDNDLTGTLPESLGGLRYLRKLDLSRNSIGGESSQKYFPVETSDGPEPKEQRSYRRIPLGHREAQNVDLPGYVRQRPFGQAAFGPGQNKKAAMAFPVR